MRPEARACQGLDINQGRHQSVTTLAGGGRQRFAICFEGDSRHRFAQPKSFSSHDAETAAQARESLLNYNDAAEIPNHLSRPGEFDERARGWNSPKILRWASSVRSERTALNKTSRTHSPTF